MRKYLLVFIGISVFLAFSSMDLSWAEEKEGAKEATEKALAEPPPKPDLLDVKMVRLDDTDTTAKKEFGGKKAIIAISQSACGNCQKELRLLQLVSKDIKGKVFLGIVMVDFDGNGERLTKYLGNQNITIPAYKDPTFSFAQQYGASFTPVTLFLDKDGKLLDQLRGFDAGADKELLAKIKEFIK